MHGGRTSVHHDDIDGSTAYQHPSDNTQKRRRKKQISEQALQETPCLAYISSRDTYRPRKVLISYTQSSRKAHRVSLN